LQTRIFTIGFTNKKAESFFEKLRLAGVKRVIDVRLNNVSQLAGFSKKDDLKYFLRSIAGIDYVHVLDLAPTKEILDAYKKGTTDWSVYEREFLKLIEHRHIETSIPRDLVDHGCLLCSEDKPHRCHRRLVAEYLKRRWSDVEIQHLT
jgi:uncharacterized protein (DUF488 family)